MAGAGAVSVVDISVLDDPRELAAAIKNALSTTGFLFVKGHGLEQQAEDMFRISERFFAEETEEEKRRCAYQNNMGYTRVSQETLDPTLPAPDLKEGFNTGHIEPGQPPVPCHPLPRLLNEHIDALLAFRQGCFAFCQRMLEAFAVALDLKPDHFTSQHNLSVDNRSILRFLHYPAVPAGAQVDPNRAGAHTDYGSCTALFVQSNGGEGLQILPPSEPLEGGKWQDVGSVEGALLLNIGDALELWSGAEFKSTLHRVRLPSPIPAEGIPARYSIAWFNQPDGDASLKTVVPVSSISARDLERMERKGVTPGTEVTSDEHLQARLASTYKQRAVA
ncbi:hypothetical protein Rhopal_004146-T1 [Rhodotorula paludigena]|uniref:Fe2OG dioxygenase domain-containing protein n=1 Tax=Rhodotorula paludigena TaxID=86838 RepID=A0AAV5GLQ0_9BASI|nr:hypothetical protein Rhopal_004146-T1 [Rhodotorula paludigena]